MSTSNTSPSFGSLVPVLHARSRSRRHAPAPGGLASGGAAAVARRVLDVALASSALLALLPLMLLVAAWVRLDSAGPALYRQERLGLGGWAFTIRKFRSMRVDAEEAGPRWASKGDPRVTRAGRVLRLFRLDELPQLLNVLDGSMALVGPRPERPCFAAELERAVPGFARRTAVKPGITGWAQVNLRYAASPDDACENLAHDLHYIEPRSLWLDFRILLTTVRVVLCRAGAR